MLQPDKRKQLDDLVSQMTQNNESEQTIKAVVDDFKKKYDISPIINDSPFNIPTNTATLQSTPQKITPNTFNNSYPTENQASSNKSNIFAAVITLAILAITGIGVYYFLIMRPANTEQVATTPAPEEKPEVIKPTPVTEPVMTLSPTKPNYLPVDIENPDNLTLKNTINDFVKKVQDSTISTPVEFLVVDTKNNPIGFETFAKKLNLKLSPAVLSDLGSEFSLFIHNNPSETRLGLSINSKNDAKLKIDLAKDEKTLPENLQPIFISTDYKFNPATFSEGIYNGIAIRYINAATGKNLSIDYAISNKQLIIGTSKAIETAILDLLAVPNTTK